MGRENGKKRHGCLISFLVFILIIVLAGAGGYFYFKSTIPEPVAFDEDDEESFYEKANIDKDNYDFEMMDLFTGNVVATGSVDVDTTFTSEELTAFFQSRNEGDRSYVIPNKPVAMSPLLMVRVTPLMAASRSYGGSNLFGNFSIRIVEEDTLEVIATLASDISGIYDIIPGLDRYSGLVDRAAGASLSLVLDMTYKPSKGFDIEVTSLKVNGIPVPQNFVEDYEPQLNDLVNGAINNGGSFVVDEFEITDDEVVFVGKFPEYLESN